MFQHLRNQSWQKKNKKKGTSQQHLCANCKTSDANNPVENCMGNLSFCSYKRVRRRGEVGVSEWECERASEMFKG
jgi:hypothetical protein